MADTRIHPTATVDPAAELGNDVTVGPYTIVEANVRIGDGSTIGSSALVASGARIGNGVRISHGAVIGTNPQDLKFAGEETTAEIGDMTVIREYVTVNRGTRDRRRTVVGSGCLLMAYVHVAHDCKLGDNVILANAVNLGGHVTIDDWAIIGGIVPVHQFVRIGKHVMIGGGIRVVQDVCPYALVAGCPLRVVSVNHVGLSRRGFSEDTIRTLKRVFRILFRSSLNTAQALAGIEAEVELIPEVVEIMDFFKASERGVTK